MAACIPTDLRDHPQWADYLTARADRVTQLAEAVRRNTQTPQTLRRFDDVLTTQLRDEIVIWRAATGVPEDDRSLLGPRTSDFAADRYARHLHRQVDALYPQSLRRWETAIATALGESRPPRRPHPRPGPRARPRASQRA